jgi:Tfp pilus assembly protein PilO
VVIFGYLLVLNKQLANYNDSRQILAGLQEKISIANFQLDESQKNASQIVELTTEEKRLLSLVLPSAPDTPSMIVHFTNLAKRAGFVASSLSFSDSVSALPNTPITAAGVQKMLIKLQLVGGNYDSFKLFLSLLEKSAIVADINSISVTDDGKSYNISLVTYYRP